MIKKVTLSALLVVLVAGGVLYFYKTLGTKKSVVESPTTSTSGVINTANFLCADNKNIQAIFLKERVELALSDGRNMLLSQAVSASGARYANPDESFVFWNKGDTAFVNEGTTTTFKDCATSAPTQPQNQLANPASVNCLKVGGNFVIQKRGDGGEYGLCYFQDNRACEEWALFRGECPYGGRKTTGFNTIDQNYCAWLGGNTTAVDNSVCTFKNGSKCSTIDLYNGTCSATAAQ